MPDLWCVCIYKIHDQCIEMFELRPATNLPPRALSIGFFVFYKKNDYFDLENHQLSQIEENECISDLN